MHFNLPLLAIVVIAGCLACSRVASKQNDQPTQQPSPPKPQISIPLGLLQLNGYFDEIPLKDKLKLSKSYMRIDLASSSSPSDPPKFSFKHSKVEELIRCSNVSLLRQGREQLIDCKTTHEITQNDLPEPTNLGENYVRRSSVRIKQRGQLVKSSRKDLLLYPLRSDVISNVVDATLAEHNLQNLRFVEPNVLFGYYFELSVFDKQDPNDRFVCNGDVYLAVNRTDLFVRYKGDPYPEYVDEFQYILSHLKDGYFFHLKEVECYKDQPGLKEMFTLALDFLIIQQQQFPYMTVRHTTQARPLTLLFDYVASVNQTRAPEPEHPDAYHTNVNIVSRSGIAAPLNFNLNQTFINLNQTYSTEQMRLVGPGLGMIIDAVWNGTKLYKVGHLYQAQDLQNAREGIELRSPFEFIYADDGNDLSVTLRFKKHLFSTLIHSLDWINDMWDAQSKDPNNFNTHADGRDEL